MTILFNKTLLYLLVCLIAPMISIGQRIDHWETVVHNEDSWYYSKGYNTIPNEWKDPGFNPVQWQKSQGGFGYGDNDDNTILTNTQSLYMRIEFDVIDTSVIAAYLLHADYDDGFVAYINGVEMARNNLGVKGLQPRYNESATDSHEANLYLNENPETYFLSNRSAFRNGKNILAIQMHNVGAASSDLSSNFFLSLGITNNTRNYRPVTYWFENILFESNLPILVITTDSGDIPDEPKVDAHMGIIYNGVNQSNSIFDPFNNYDGRIGIEIRGTSSQMYPKKGYGLETRLNDGSNNNVELLGMPEENDWVLHAPYADKSLIRNVFSYHMGRLTGHYAPRTRYCELFINSQYQGVYVLTERIKRDKNRVDISKLTETENSGDDLTGGYIIKIDRNPYEIPELGWYSTFPDNKFIAYEYPKYDKITTEQRDFIQRHLYNFESAMNRSNYEDTYLKYINVNSWVDYFLISELSKHIDVYKLSFYMYKDKESKGGKLHMGPLWDMNFGYGNFNFNCSPNPEGWAYEFPLCGSWHPFWARKIANIPNLQHLTDCRWQELRAGPLQNESLLRFIDDQVAYLGEAVDRNFQRWPILGKYVWANDFIGSTYLDEVNFLKNWTLQRLEWMDENMVGECDQYVSNSNISNHLKLNIFPNPTRDLIYIENLHKGEKITSLDLIDMHGRILETRGIQQNNISMNVKNLADGLYLIQARAQGQIVQQHTFSKHSTY